MHSMKRLCSIVIISLLSLTALANEYTDKLIVTVNGVSVEQQTTISIVQDEDRKYTLSLNNFCLESLEEDGSITRLGVGNIVLANREGSTVDGITSITYNDNLIITDGDDPEIPYWMGPMLGPVPIEMKARFTDTQLYCEIHIDLTDLLGQIIDVVFGSEPEVVVEEVLTAPTINKKEGESNTLTISVGTTSNEGETVITYYTTDGTEPSADNGTAITEDTDVELTADCIVKTIAISSSGKQSEVIEYNFSFEPDSGIRSLSDSMISRDVDSIYDLQGRKITSDKKHGLYIVNGKKILVR